MALDVLYLLAILCFSPVLLWRAIRQKKYRDGWGQKALGLIPDLPPAGDGRIRIWFHAVSVGEVGLLRPLVRILDDTRQDVEFVVSSTSRAGYELAQKLFGDRVPVFYCPLDFTWATKRAVRRIKPDVLALAELELWPHLIRAAKDFGAKTVIFNGRVGDSSFRNYLRVRPFLAPVFRRIDQIIAQDQLAFERFRALAPNHPGLSVSGSVKFDGVCADRDAPATRRLGALAEIGADDLVFLAGSTQSPEEEGALEVFRRLSADFPNLKLILVPRHPERFEEVARLLEASEFTWTRRSALNDSVRPAPGSRILLVDAVGELGAWWGLAHIAFVGGSWGSRGGQNMLEPSGYGAAVSFGPNTKNFRTIVESLLRVGGAVVVKDVDELEAFVRRCAVDVEYRDQLGGAARRLVLANSGAARRTVDLLLSSFPTK